MAYFVSTSQHPATLICVKNKAISELQWRNRDLLQLAEQSHSLSKMALWAEQLPFSTKTSKQSKNAPKQAVKSPWIKVAASANIEINSIDVDSDPQVISHQVSPPNEVPPAQLSPANASSLIHTMPQSTSTEIPQALTRPVNNSSMASSWSWSGLGVGGLLLAAAAGGGSGSKPSTNNTSSGDKQTDINQQSIDTTAQLQGLVMAGPLKADHGLTVDVFDANGLKLASNLSIDAFGYFSFTLKNMAGKPVLIQVSDKDNAPDYTDEASGQPKDMAMNLRAVIIVGKQSSQQMSVTPLTELVAQMLLKNQSPQMVARLDKLALSDITAYSLAVSKALGIDEQIPVTDLQPVDLLNNTEIGLNNNSSAVKYAKTLAVLSSMEKAGSTDLQAAINTLQQGMREGHDGKLSKAVLQQLLIDVHHHGRIITKAEIQNQLDPNNSIVPVENDVYRLTSDWIPDRAAPGTNGIVVGNLQKNTSDIGSDGTVWTVDDSTNFKVVGQQLIFIGEAANFQQKRYYGITMSLEDGSYSQSFTVQVNTAPTSISLSQNLVPENINTNALIGEINITDKDGLGNNVLTLSGEDSVFFSVNGRQLVRNNYMPANLSKSNYQFKVTSTDGSLVYSRDINLQVNKAPTAINIAGSLVVNDGVSLPVNLGTITINDDNLGTNVLSISGSDKRFFSISNNGLKFNATAQDLTNQSTFSFTLTSTDGGLVFNQNFSLKINKAPTDITLSSNTINENISVSGNGVLVGTLSVVDDGLGTNTLSLTGDDAASFALSGNNLMFIGASPDYETKSRYSITVKSTDTNLSLNRLFDINVTNINEAPSGIVLSSALLPQGVSVGSGLTVGSIQVTDDGLGNNTLSLIPGGDASMFAISGTTLVYKGSTPNFSNKPVYNFSIKTTDSANSALTFTQAITVKVNQAPTAITPSWTLSSLPENTVIGSGIELATLTTTDDGLGNNSLSVSDTTNFSIVNNKLYFVGASPDFENRSGYTFTLKSTDGRLTYTSSTLNLAVSNVNEAPKNFTLNTTSFNEGTTVKEGFNVATLNVTDDNLADTNTYSIDGVDAKFFKIAKIKDTNVSNISGYVKKLIYTGPVPNFESGKNRFDITIKSTDGSLVYRKDFTVNVNDTNDEPTSIYLTNIQSLQERTVIGTGILIGKLNVVDDALGSITYTLDTTKSDSNFFTIRSNQLYYTSSTPLDFKSKPRYVIAVKATDTTNTNLNITQELAVDVTAVNLAPSGITLSNNKILQGMTVDAYGLLVGTLQVTDDGNGNNTLSIGGADQTQFAIVGNVLYYTGGRLDYNRKSNYSINIISTDGSLVFNQAITVNVLPPPVNEVNNPVLNLLTLPQGTNKTFGLADFGLAQASIGVDVIQITINSLPASTSGTLKFNNANVSLGQQIRADQLASLNYVPVNSSANGYGQASFNYSLSGSGVPTAGKSLVLDGINDYVNLGSITTNGEITIEAWVKPANLSANNLKAHIFDLGNGQSNHNIVLELDRFTAYVGSSVVNSPINIPQNLLVIDSWIHLAATIKNNLASVYVNGILTSVNGFNTSLAQGDGSFIAPDIVMTRTSNFIGKSNWSTDPYFKGEIADARIYDKARTWSEIQQDMAGYVDISDTTLLRREVADLNDSVKFSLVNGPTYTNFTNTALIHIQTGKIGWGDGSGYGNFRPELSPDGGGDSDRMSGTNFADLLFGDGSGGGAVGNATVGLAGSGNDVLSAGAGADILFGDGFTGRNGDGGYGGGGGGDITWYGVGYGGIGAGDGRSGDVFNSTNSWLGPLNLSTNNQWLQQNKPLTNWGAGAGVRNGTRGNITDQVWSELNAPQASAAYGSRGVYAKVLWDLSQGTTGFGSGSPDTDTSASGYASTTIDPRVYKQITGIGNDVLRGGTGNDWLMGGGGTDAFVWGDSDLDGGKDYIVDFHALENDVIRLDSGALVGYTSGADLSPWFKLQTGLRTGSPFEAANGIYSLLQIDATGNRNFATPAQTIYFRSDALNHLALNDFIQITNSAGLEETPTPRLFDAQLTNVNWHVDRGRTGSLDTKDVLRLRFNQVVELDPASISSAVFGSGFVVKAVNGSNNQSQVWEVTLGNSPTLTPGTTLTINDVFNDLKTSGSVSRLLTMADLSSSALLRFNAVELNAGITFDGWVTPNTDLSIQWGNVKDNLVSDTSGYWSYSFYGIESYFGRKAPGSQQDAAISLRQVSDNTVLWQQIARIDDSAPELLSLKAQSITGIAAKQSISLNLGLSEDLGDLLTADRFQTFGGSLQINPGNTAQRSALFTSSELTLPTLARVQVNKESLKDLAFNSNTVSQGLDIPVSVNGLNPLRPLSRELQLRQGQTIRLDLRDPAINTNTSEWQIEIRGLGIGHTLNQGTLAGGFIVVPGTALAGLQLQIARESTESYRNLTVTYLKNNVAVSQANLTLQVMPWLKTIASTYIEDYNNFSQVWEAWNLGLTGLSGEGVIVDGEATWNRPELDNFEKGRVLYGSKIGVTDTHGYGVTQRLAGGWNSDLTGVAYKATVGWDLVPNADIDNNSWGAGDFPAIIGPLSVDCLRHGRNNLGQIVVFSSGNDSNKANVSVTVNKNYPGYFAIASLSRSTGEVTDFSTVGENLTGAVTGNGGTSHAAPHAAGIFALMLEANPGLGFRDVQSIVAYSARYLSTATPYAGFSVNGANTLNGAGPHFSHLAGFGAINAYNACRLAIDWLKAGYAPATAGNWTQKVSEDTNTVFSYNSRTLSTSANVDVSAFLNFNQAIDIGEIELSARISDPNFSSLDVNLISPDRTSFSFAKDPSAPADFNGIFTSKINILNNSYLNQLFTQGTWQLDFSHKTNTTSAAVVTDIQLSFKDTSLNTIQTISDASFKSYTVSPTPGVVTQTSLNVSQSMTVQTVVVEAFFDDSDFTYLNLDLISPSGTISPILTGNTNNGGSRSMELQLPTKRFWGESSLGTWQLRFSHSAPAISDGVTLENATIKDIRLLFLGDEASADQRYVYTDEMRNTYLNTASETTKKKMLWLDDRDNGNDSFMGSALGSALTLDLGPHGWFTLNGFQVRMTPGTRIENAFSGDGNDVLQGLHDGKSMLNGNAGTDVLMAYGYDSQIDGGIADDWLWAGGNSIATGGQGGDNFIVFKGQSSLPDMTAINTRITDFDLDLDHIFSYETNGVFTQAKFDLSGNLYGWVQVNDSSLIQTLTQQQSMSAKPDLLAVSMSGSSLTLSFDQALISTGTLSCQLDGLALQSSSLNGKFLTLNYLNTGSGVHQLDFANAGLYNALGKKPDFNKLYLGTANAEQLDAGSSGLSVALFGSGGADTLIGGNADDLLAAPTGANVRFHGGNGADVFRIKNAGMNGNIYIDDFSILQGDRLDLDDLLSEFAANTLIESCVQISRNSSDALLKFDLSGAGAFNSNALSIQLSGIYARQTVAEVTLRSLMYGLQADTVI